MAFSTLVRLAIVTFVVGSTIVAGSPRLQTRETDTTDATYVLTRILILLIVFTDSLTFVASSLGANTTRRLIQANAGGCVMAARPRSRYGATPRRRSRSLATTRRRVALTGLV